MEENKQIKTNQSLNYKIAMTGVFGGLSIILSFTPLGFITVGGFISITIMHIPAILACLTAGLVPGMSVGLIFGLASLTRTAMMGGGANPFFMNPLVSVLPRILFPVVVWAIFKLFNLIPKMPKVISGSIAAATGTFCHTAFVMFAIYALYGKVLVTGMAGALGKFGFNPDLLTGIKGYFAIMIATLATNGVWEIIAATLLTAAFMGSVYAVKARKSKISKMEDSE